MSDEIDVTDDYLKRIALFGLPPDASAELLPKFAEKLRKDRAALRRVEAVLGQLEQRTRDPASVMWAAELRAAITGRKFLYRCPEHGDREASSQRHERGVNCGKPLPPPWKRPGSSVCSQTAVLVGEIEAP